MKGLGGAPGSDPDGEYVASAGVTGVDALHLWDLLDPPDAAPAVLKWLDAAQRRPSGRWLRSERPMARHDDRLPPRILAAREPPQTRAAGIRRRHVGARVHPGRAVAGLVPAGPARPTVAAGPGRRRGPATLATGAGTGPAPDPLRLPHDRDPPRGHARGRGHADARQRPPRPDRGRAVAPAAGRLGRKGGCGEGGLRSPRPSRDCVPLAPRHRGRAAPGPGGVGPGVGAEPERPARSVHRCVLGLRRRGLRPGRDGSRGRQRRHPPRDPPRGSEGGRLGGDAARGRCTPAFALSRDGRNAPRLGRPDHRHGRRLRGAVALRSRGAHVETDHHARPAAVAPRSSTPPAAPS